MGHRLLSVTPPESSDDAPAGTPLAIGVLATIRDVAGRCSPTPAGAVGGAVTFRSSTCSCWSPSSCEFDASVGRGDSHTVRPDLIAASKAVRGRDRRSRLHAGTRFLDHGR